MKAHLKRLASILALALLASAASAQTGWTNLFTVTGFSGTPTVTPTASVVDGNGNIFVTGAAYDYVNNYDYATIKYSNAGMRLWTNLYDAQLYANGNFPNNSYNPAIAVDANGNAFLTGTMFDGANYDFATIKYSSAGMPVLTNLYTAASGAQASAVAVDRSGNAFVTGQSFDGTNYAYATIKYSSAGVSLWTNIFYSGYNAPYAAPNFGSAIAVDGNGNAFMAGTMSWSNNNNYATIKYSSAGLPLWTNRYTDTVDAGYTATAIAVDGNGNIFVTGYNAESQYYVDCYTATLKYSNAGLPLWTNRYTSAGGYAANPALALDGSGNVFVTQISGGKINWEEFGYGGYTTIKYSGAGVPLWTNNTATTPYGVGFNSPAIAVDSSGNSFVTGFFLNYDYADAYSETIKYSSAGVSIWTNTRTNFYDVSGVGNSLAVDGSGNAFVTGAKFDTSGNQNYVTIKYPAPAVPAPAYLRGQWLNQEMVLSWTNAGFSLQAAPAVTGTFTNVPGATSPFTNPVTAAQQFFRLKQ